MASSATAKLTLGASYDPDDLPAIDQQEVRILWERKQGRLRALPESLYPKPLPRPIVDRSVTLAPQPDLFQVAKTPPLPLRTPERTSEDVRRDLEQRAHKAPPADPDKRKRYYALLGKARKVEGTNMAQAKALRAQAERMMEVVEDMVRPAVEPAQPRPQGLVDVTGRVIIPVVNREKIAFVEHQLYQRGSRWAREYCEKVEGWHAWPRWLTQRIEQMEQEHARYVQEAD